MIQGDIYDQADGAVRYVYECPRGSIAIDELPGGHREITRCLGGRDISARDIREAVELHEEILADAEVEA